MTDEQIDVLIIDDSEVALKTIGLYFEGRGLNVIYEKNPEKALVLIKQQLPKVIFVDYYMPELTGKDVAIKFSEMKLFKHCSINLICGKSFNANEIFSLMSLGYEHILKKPLDENVLAEILIGHFPEKFIKSA